MEDFKYHTTSTLLKYVGKEVQWLDLSGKVKSGVLEGNSKRTWLPEACNPFAETVKIKLS